MDTSLTPNDALERSVTALSVRAAGIALVVGAGTALLVSAAAAQQVHSETHDAAIAAPQHHKLLLENDSVRVFETRIGPGEKTPVHAHPWPSALYILNWSDFVRYDADGKVLLDSRTMSSKPQPGTALWSAPVGPHLIHNVGTSELLVIAVEIKQQ